jgi:hypothetical protein
MINIDNTLETFIMADYSIARLMHKLRRLAIREYNLNNYGECSKRCINWFKLYSIMLPSYIQYDDIFTTKALNTESLNNPDYRFNFIINQLRDSKYKEALYWYTDCRKFLVGPKAYCLIEKINTILPKHERYEAFMTFSDIVVADKGLHNTYAHYQYMSETQSILKKAKKYNSMISCKDSLDVLNSISINPRVVAKPNTPKKNTQNDCENITVNNTHQTHVLPFSNVVTQKSDVIRLTYDNAKVGMIISYVTKKGKEYAKITKVCKEYPETLRLKKDKSGNYIPHNVCMCKASKNKPEYTRVISIITQ